MSNNCGNARRSCCLCQTFEGKHPHWINRPILRESDFFVLPSVGSIVPGWCMVVPDEHVTSAAHLTLDQRKVAFSLVNFIGRHLSACFGTPVYWFEHGPARPGSAVGCSVDHAHLHVVPLPFDLPAAAVEDCPEYSWEEVTGLAEPASVLSKLAMDDYVIAGAVDRKTCVFTRGGTFPSQLLRRIIARRCGRGDEWNWREHPHYRNAMRTANLLKNCPARVA